jgi:hypothetical protein
MGTMSKMTRNSRPNPWDKYPVVFTKSLVVSVMLISCWLPVHALDIYQWVDDSGKTHMSEMVPEKFKATAKRVDSRRYEVSDDQRNAALARAAKDKRLLAPKQIAEVAQPTVVNDAKPVEPVQQSTCSKKWDEYYRSQECFAPFLRRFSGGATLNPEAYSKCKNVNTPAMECDYDKRQSVK